DAATAFICSTQAEHRVRVACLRGSAQAFETERKQRCFTTCLLGHAQPIGRLRLSKRHSRLEPLVGWQIALLLGQVSLKGGRRRTSRHASTVFIALRQSQLRSRSLGIELNVG